MFIVNKMAVELLLVFFVLFQKRNNLIANYNALFFVFQNTFLFIR